MDREIHTAVTGEAQTGSVCRGSAKSNCSGGRNETSVRENNWRLMLIIKLSNESIRFSPVDGFSLSRPGGGVYKPSSFFHLLRTKHSTGRDCSSCLLGWTGQTRMGTLTWEWELREILWLAAASSWWGAEGHH